MRSCRGQAMAELAVFGSLFLLVVSALIRFGLATTYRQELQQEAFRRALGAARGDNAESNPNDAGGAQMIADRLVPNPVGPFALSSRSRVQAGSVVLWANDLFQGGGHVVSAHSPRLININGRQFAFESQDVRGGGLQPDVVKDVAVDATLTRQEDPAGITTVNESAQTETITSLVRTTGGEQPVVSTLRRARGIRIETPFEEPGP